MKQFITVLPVPVNQKYVSRTFVLARPYRECMEAIGWSVPHSIKMVEKPKRMGMKIAFHISRDRDVDSGLKCLLDGLEGRLFENDSQVQEIHVMKIKVKRGEEQTVIKPYLLDEQLSTDNYNSTTDNAG